MRIALVTETYPPEVNGVAMTLGRLADGLRQRGHTLHLVRPRQVRGEQPAMTADLREMLVGSLPLPRYPGLRFGLPAHGALLKSWREQRPDIVHVATEGPLGWSALTAARRLDLPISSSFHTNFDAYSGHYGIGWMRGSIERYLRHFHNRSQVTLVPTQEIVRRLTSADFQNLKVMARGVDTQLFNPQRRSAALRQQWGADANTLVVATVGRLAAEKNLDLAVFAFDALHRAYPNSRLLFVGDGPQKSALAARHPEHIFAGMRHGEDLAAHYASADIFLLPSLTETYGNVTLEAMASGLGVVAYASAAALDLIDDGRNGLLAPPGDEQRFIGAAISLAGNAGLLARLRLRAPARVSRLGWDAIHDTFADILEDLALIHSRRRHRAVVKP
ncbi:MAG: glycosyltransferase family 1 protein [Gammaproteobacteria bacterium]|nr:glycosyltransferase family 1 protein [Rhodocyclaceae bacterium]MBU3908796.1 glycosyltransferase family 1 protein [Gammaproteobacteria bacterium]MBU3988405.1 glycosyltransferase family 1 protein [Gammaproteobacteria bacterium]MBU4004824.1 glycosyltransferase family 1 protein [Gammaproteobacteria bacterium]MBU4021427.1 glycosyltransferase family 1 protein [Gammaproteobacteria bacterium]